ncbi:protein phosphatase 2C domain-containing protein [Pseudomonas nicosulfuronedens]|uniref:PP2C family protein-serine/threonine phosphatase n=2 Tax=Pseudomonas nicosulfuronedens TaxID=2571105 RepID=UPI00244C4989|nr:protein phosphatase 2C domain-containing protein [Pseudomonas nicosulfuronedens]MDH1009003.1 protein phosphatase 2C domain-containing protein [Pseudomonas nicosulfuronedens]MDH1977916.1 protein phosphatase 2C domain-containing protein [Pseudomonas nicosulfuronedens]MDH2028694.1 protein phosphatase 2C domain-containing protein [Pseudomonas nicosulfuronedens]
MNHTAKSFKGRVRGENRDYAHAVIDERRGLFVVVDGTSKSGSGQLAQDLAQNIADTYQSRVSLGAEDGTFDLSTQLIRSVLLGLHTPLFSERSGSASYLIALITNGQLIIGYEGDCSCGLVDTDERIDWITSPHCLANWQRNRSHPELARDPARNKISRSFRAGRTPDPEFVTRAATPGQRLILATDGFWAELSEARQAEALRAPEMVITDVDDDVTWVDVHL